jgi:hypothetical protein
MAGRAETGNVRQGPALQKSDRLDWQARRDTGTTLLGLLR